MEDEQILIFGNAEQSIAPLTQQLIQHLESLWKRPYKLSPEMLNRIIKILVQLPEPQKVAGMTKIAEYLANVLSLHFIDMIAIFQQKAESEGIDKEESIQTLQGVIAEMFPEMMGISKHIHIRSIDDLVTLGNITLSLHTLSQVDSAQEAQNWMYELPVLYWRQLNQERLVSNFQSQVTVSHSSTTTNISGYASWKSSLPNPVELPLITYGTSTIA